MISPSVAAGRLLCACLLGILCGIWYGFLRPLRPRFTALSDLLFLSGGAACWGYLSFAICQGDLRLGYTAGLFLGGFLWECTIGRLLRPVFSSFWNVTGLIFSKAASLGKRILKKMRKFRKMYLHLRKNRVQ